MKKHLLFSFLLFLGLQCLQAEVITVSHYVDQAISVPAGTELHITGETNVLVRSTVTLEDESSWLYFDNMRPSVVLETYQSSIFIKGEALIPEGNAQVRVYSHGTVIIPHTPDYQALEVFTGQAMNGSSRKYSLHVFHRDLQEFDNAIRSFRLKKGYMATVAVKSDGTGYSRVFIADKEDLEMNELPALLDQTISFIRVFRWDWTSKKGWCGGDPALVDKIEGTWYYSWSADKVSTPNYQYVPIKQHHGWPSFDEINNKTNVCHLLAYNEPDHTDQANMTVEQAIAQWPEMLKTGYRLGSPVPSNPGNGNGWLYRFMDKCDSLNYRVDYVVVHAYWGGKSPQSWYSSLKSEYEKCGRRPLWITEWNNGANWTSDNWPADPEEQKQKQLSDLKKILHVLDTCSFVERYSIYDWVNEGMVSGQKKTVIRAMFWDGKLTPAGEYYRDNRSALAFNPAYEQIPVWKIEEPSLSYSLTNDGIKLTCLDVNEGLAEQYVVERRVNDGEFVGIAQLAPPLNEYTDVSLNESLEGIVTYRIKANWKDGSAQTLTNEVKYHMASGKGNFQYGTTSLNDTGWSFFQYKEAYSENPVVIFGPSLYSSSLPMSQRIKSIGKSNFQFHLDTWSYLSNQAFPKEVRTDYLVVPKGNHDLGGVQAQAASFSNVGGAWRTVSFPTPFDQTPVVFANLITSRNPYAIAVRIRNVSTSGFEVQLQKEAALMDENATIASLENINYLALTPGSGTIDGHKIQVGLTAESSVGTIYAPAKVVFDENVIKPLLFGFMQTTTSDIVSTLQYTDLKSSEVRLLRHPELSKGGSPAAGGKEQAAWMVIETDDSNSSIEGFSADDSAIQLYPNPVADVLFLKNTTGAVLVEVFSAMGERVQSEMVTGQLNLQGLPSGLYFVRINNSIYKLLKN